MRRLDDVLAPPELAAARSVAAVAEIGMTPAGSPSTRRRVLLAGAGVGAGLLRGGIDAGRATKAPTDFRRDPTPAGDGRSVSAGATVKTQGEAGGVAHLDDHRIARVVVDDLVSRYPRPVGRNSHLGSHGSGPTSPIALVRTDQGAVGWGLLRGPADGLDGLVGRRLADLFDPAVGVIAEEADPLDVALHDLAGVILRQPVYRMIGAHDDPIVPCYDGAIYLDDLDPEQAPSGVDAVLRNCAADYALGYRAFKLKIGRGYRWMQREAGLRRDIEVTRAVGERFPDCTMLVDANDGYDVDGFIAYLDGVGDVDLFWVEEPFEERREDLARLRAYLARRRPTTLIADGELRPDIPFLLELAAAGLVDVLLMDVLSLGLTGWRRLMPELRRIGVAASPHAWGVPLKTLYCAQIAAGLGNVPTVEAVPGSAPTVDTGAYRLEEGSLRVPELPGFGIDPPPTRSTGA